MELRFYFTSGGGVEVCQAQEFSFGVTCPCPNPPHTKGVQGTTGSPCPCDNPKRQKWVFLLVCVTALGFSRAWPGKSLTAEEQSRASRAGPSSPHPLPARRAQTLHSTQSFFSLIALCPNCSFPSANPVSCPTQRGDPHNSILNSNLPKMQITKQAGCSKSALSVAGTQTNPQADVCSILAYPSPQTPAGLPKDCFCP